MNTDTLVGAVCGFFLGVFLIGLLLMNISTPNKALIIRGFAHYNATNGNFELNQ